MATTLMTPKVKIYRWTFGEIDVLEFEEHLNQAVDQIRGVSVSDSMKVTWLPVGDIALLCIVEWCEWAPDANH